MTGDDDTLIYYSPSSQESSGGAGNITIPANVATVNALLAGLAASVLTLVAGVLNLAGVGVPAPTGQGLVNKATLVAAGWTVITN